MAGGVFAVICLGGLVTSYSAAMSIPDWPTAFGRWFHLPDSRDPLLAQAERLAAMLLLPLAIALTVVLWRRDHRKWTPLLGIAAVAGICLQGAVGGLRVVHDAYLLAKLHACLAPLLLALCAAAVAVTSRGWQTDDESTATPSTLWLPVLATLVAAAIYVQIFFGAQLRHLPIGGEPERFVLWIWLKVITAAMVAVGVVWLLVLCLRRARSRPAIVRRASVLSGLMLLQLLLGGGAWVTRYGWPAWFREGVATFDYTVVQDGLLQTVTATAHVAIGALNFAAAASLAIWSWRAWRSSVGRSAA